MPEVGSLEAEPEMGVLVRFMEKVFQGEGGVRDTGWGWRLASGRTHGEFWSF